MRWPLASLLGLVLALAVSGCSGDESCRGQTYDETLSQDGSGTPIEALELWLGGHDGLPTPPDENWVQKDSGDTQADEVVITNEDGDGWWVSASRTSSGGWVVTQATDDATGCGDDLSG